jgi:hypothetical protein
MFSHWFQYRQEKKSSKNDFVFDGIAEFHTKVGSVLYRVLYVA